MNDSFLSPAVGNGWDAVSAPLTDTGSYQELCAFLHREYAEEAVYPPREKVFNALALTPPETVRAVIVGQDPYINPGQAQGLAFSVPPETALPPSLQNICKELLDDTGAAPSSGCLIPWALQGVLLLNTVLTVRAGASGSHHGRGWEAFTDGILAHLGAQERPLVFILWGAPAQKKAALVTNPAHLVLKAPHPSPLSAYRGFFGSRPFSAANAFLRERGLGEIAW